MKRLAFAFLLMAGTAHAHELQPTIIGGGDEEWPAVLQVFTPTTFCSGTLIAPDVVLTAAHCLADNPADPMWVSWYSDTYYEHSVAYRVAHPDWNVAPNLEGDAALLFLTVPTVGITPATLFSRPAGSWRAPEAWHDHVKAWGWGITRRTGEGGIPDTLQGVVLHNESLVECEQRASFFYGIDLGDLDDHTVCAADWNEGICSGDSGGAMTTWNDFDEDVSNEEIAGIHSFVLECGLMSFSQRVDLVTHWIIDTINAYRGRPGCPPTPNPECRTTTESVTLRASARRITWKWSKHGLFPQHVKTKPLSFCLYDSSGLIYDATIPPELRCTRGRECWQQEGKAWIDRGKVKGLRRVKYVRGDEEDDRSRISVRVNPGVFPTGVVTAQLHASHACFQTIHTVNRSTKPDDFWS